MESVNLLSDDFRSYEYSSIVQSIEEIMTKERIEMVEAQPSLRSFNHLPRGAVVDDAWQTGWCSDDDLRRHKLLYNLPRQAAS